MGRHRSQHPSRPSQMELDLTVARAIPLDVVSESKCGGRSSTHSTPVFANPASTFAANGSGTADGSLPPSAGRGRCSWRPVLFLMEAICNRGLSASGRQHSRQRGGTLRVGACCSRRAPRSRCGRSLTRASSPPPGHHASGRAERIRRACVRPHLWCHRRRGCGCSRARTAAAPTCFRLDWMQNRVRSSQTSGAPALQASSSTRPARVRWSESRFRQGRQQSEGGACNCGAPRERRSCRWRRSWPPPWRRAGAGAYRQRRRAVMPLVFDNALAVIDAETGRVSASSDRRVAPFGAVVSRMGARLVSNWGGRWPKDGTSPRQPGWPLPPTRRCRRARHRVNGADPCRSRSPGGDRYARGGIASTAMSGTSRGIDCSWPTPIPTRCRSSTPAPSAWCRRFRSSLRFEAEGRGAYGAGPGSRRATLFVALAALTPWRLSTPGRRRSRLIPRRGIRTTWRSAAMAPSSASPRSCVGSGSQGDPKRAT